MDFGLVPYQCSPDSSDSSSPQMEQTKKRFCLSIRFEQLSAEMSDT